MSKKVAINILHHTDWDSIDRAPGSALPSYQPQTVLLRDRLKYVYLIIEICKKWSGFDPKDLLFVICDNSNWYVYDLLQELNNTLLNGEAIILSTLDEMKRTEVKVIRQRRQFGDGLMSLRSAQICYNLDVDWVYRINARYIPLMRNFFVDAVNRMQKFGCLVEFVPWFITSLNDPEKVINPCYFPYHTSAIDLFENAAEYVRTQEKGIDTGFANYKNDGKFKDKILYSANVDFSMWNQRGTWFGKPHPGVYYIDEIVPIALKSGVIDQETVDKMIAWQYKPTFRIAEYYYRQEFYYKYPYDFEKEKGWKIDPVYTRYLMP